MINLDISNVWTCVSLPDLLRTEKEIFDAHSRLQDHRPDGPDFQSWLDQPETITGRLIHGIRRRAELICGNSDVLVVCGSGNTYDAAQAAIELYGGAGRNFLSRPQVIFTGNSLSGRQWVELGRLLEDKDYSLHVISADGYDLGVNVTVRGLRWMMERKYSAKTKERISVATVVGTPLHKMAQEEGYELFPMPVQMGGRDSALTAAAMVPMAVSGIDPLSVLEGAVECSKLLDIRSFENPAWLYAGIRGILPGKGRPRELLCVFDHNLAAFGRWWQRYAWRHECREGMGVFPETALLPGDLDALDAMLCSGSSNVFETLLHFDPITKKIPVEMDWKDYDGLGFLSGRNLDFVEGHVLRAMTEAHNDRGIPVLDICAGELTAETLGELFCFFELSSALAACTWGIEPFAPTGKPSTELSMEQMQES